MGPVAGPRNPTRSVWAGPLRIGGGAPISVQSMCATRTGDIDATVSQAEALRAAGADLVRVAVDSKRDALSLDAIRAATVKAAALLGMESDVGAIAPGYFADLIAVDGNPLDDVTLLQDVRVVIKGGKVIKSPEFPRGYNGGE